MKNKLNKIILYIQRMWSETIPSENEIKVNGLMKICFYNRSTIDALETFKLFETKFKEELSVRQSQALLDNANIEEYFKKNVPSVRNSN